MNKDTGSLFQKHREKLNKEAFVRALVSGTAVGSFAMLVTALTAWFFDAAGVWLPITAFLIFAAAATGALYWFKYKPSEQYVARRIDATGLEERAITMLELAEDDSYVAQLQREDTARRIGESDGEALGLRISQGSLTFMAITLAIAVAITVVHGLAAADMIPGGMELLNPTDPYADRISVNYSAGLGGKIVGAPEQLVLSGDSAESVVAVAEYGYVFVGWSDGYGKPARVDDDVRAPINVTALFEELGFIDDEDEEDGDEANDPPMESEMSQSGSGQGGSSDTEESDPDTGEDEGGNDSSDSTGLGSAGKWEDGNQFIDGETYYRDHLDMYYEMAMKIFEETGEIPPEMRDFFEKYFGGI